MATYLYDFNAGTPGQAVVAGTNGVDTIIEGVQTYVAGIHGAAAIRAGDSANKTSSMFGITMPFTGTHSGSAYFQYNTKQGTAGSLNFLILQCDNGAYANQFRISSAADRFAVTTGSTITFTGADNTVPPGGLFRLDWQFQYVPGGTSTLSWRLFTSDREGVTPDLSGTVDGYTGPASFSPPNRLRLGANSSNNAAFKDITVDTVRISDDLRWWGPFAAPVAQPGTLNRTWLGAPKTTGFTVCSKTVNATSLRLAVSTASDLSNPTWFGPVAPANGGYAMHVATGLTAGTRYYYGLYDTPAGGTESLISTASGRARTLPPSGPQNFTFATGSCVSTNATDAVSLEDIRVWDPVFFAHLGDFHYKSGQYTDAASHAADLEAQILAVPEYRPLLRDVPTFYTFSDHEAGPDNADPNVWTQPLHDAVAYAVPHLPYGDTRSPAVTHDQTWSVGRIGFFMVDDRSNDRSTGAADPSDTSKTMLGAAQLARLLAWIGDGQHSVKVMLCDQPWMGPASNTYQDKWWSYAVERQTIINRVQQVGVPFMLIHGDAHSLGYATAAKNANYGGFPVFCGSPLAQVGGGLNLSEFSGTYNTTTSVRGSAYGRFTVTDTGTTISIAFSGWDAKNATERLAYTYVVNTVTEEWYIYNGTSLATSQRVDPFQWNGSTLTPVAFHSKT